MTGEELNNHLNAARAAAGAKTVRWTGASAEYKQAMTTAAADLSLTQGSPAVAAAQAAAPVAAAPAAAAPDAGQPIAAPLGVDPGEAQKVKVFVANLPAQVAQFCYEMLHIMRGCRIYRH